MITEQMLGDQVQPVVGTITDDDSVEMLSSHEDDIGHYPGRVNV